MSGEHQRHPAEEPEGPWVGLHDQVLSRVGRDLAHGRLSAGAVLSLEQLSARYAASRTVVREVVKVLESLRMLSSRRRVGITVRPLEEWNVFDPLVIRWRLDGPDRPAVLRSLSELRMAAEPAAAALAAVRATPEQCGALTSAVIGMSVTGRARDLEAYLGHDQEFHRTVLAASGNEMLRALAQIVDEVLAGRTHHDLMPARPRAAAIRLHADVSDAIAGGDAAAAEKAMRAIVAEAMSAVEEASTDG